MDWVYLDDVVEVLILAAVAEGAEGHTLAVGSGEVASIRGVVHQLADLVDADLDPIFGAVEDRPLNGRSARTSSQPAGC